MVSFFSYFSENIVSYLIILQSYVIFFAYTNISKTFFALTLKFNKKATASNIPVMLLHRRQRKKQGGPKPAKVLDHHNMNMSLYPGLPYLTTTVMFLEDVPETK